MDGLYITEEMAGRALNKMYDFNQKLSALYESEGLDKVGHWQKKHLDVVYTRERIL